MTRYRWSVRTMLVATAVVAVCFACFGLLPAASSRFHSSWSSSILTRFAGRTLERA